MSNKQSVKPSKKASCPFGRHCFSDSSVCGYIGYYAECPERLSDRIYVEIEEGGYQGLDPYTLLMRARYDE